MRCTDVHFSGKSDVSFTSHFCFEPKSEVGVSPKQSFPILFGISILLFLSNSQKDKALSCRNVLGRGKITRTGDWQEVRAAAPTQMQATK